MADRPNNPLIPDLFKAEMFQPVEAPMTTAMAKTALREALQQMGVTDKAGIRQVLAEFASDLWDDEDVLRTEIRAEIDTLMEERADLQSEIADQRKDHAECLRAGFRAEPRDDSHIDELVARRAAAASKIGELRAELEEIKRCKRDYLVGYLNEQLCGIPHQIRRKRRL